MIIGTAAFAAVSMYHLKIEEKGKYSVETRVTHDVDEAVYMGTRVIVMDSNPGRVVGDIKIAEGYPRDRSSNTFVEYRNEILNRLHFGGRN